MQRLRAAIVLAAAAALAAPGPLPGLGAAAPVAVIAAAQATEAPAPPAATPDPAPVRSVQDILGKGVVITISLASQQMHVFRDGVLWRSSPVSTGKKGKETPEGVFAILQKKTFHRSNLYSNAPMPFMQRLTWDGIAIHAGHLPGYPASHGCIRIPKAFAAELFSITNAAATAVIVTKAPLGTGPEALALARGTDAPVPISPALLRRERPALAKAAPPRAPPPPADPAARLPAARTIEGPMPAELLPPALVPPAPAPASAPALKGQTIQLAAELSEQSAASRWAALAAQRPELRQMQMAVVPAMVNGTRYYRLRASAPGAHDTCKALKRAGIDCFPVS